MRAPLHPAVLSEGAASLLPGEDRPALLWQIDLDGDGAMVGDASLVRALVRSRAALDYAAVQAAIDGGTADDNALLLREVGEARQHQEEACAAA